MELKQHQIVLSVAGHDKGKLFCVLDTQDDFVLLADGKERKLDAPKRKRCKHVRGVGISAHPAIVRLQRGEPVQDSDLRRALAAFRDSDQGGNHLWQKTM